MNKNEMGDQTNPFDFLFDEISKILKMVQNGELKTDMDKMPPDFDKRIEELRKKVVAFGRISEDIVKLSGVSAEELKLRLEGISKEIPEDGKELIQRSKEIRSQAQEISDRLEITLQGVPSAQLDQSALASTPDDKKIKDEDYAKKRRSKFKRFGGDNKWKPL